MCDSVQSSKAWPYEVVSWVLGVGDDSILCAKQRRQASHVHGPKSSKKVQKYRHDYSPSPNYSLPSKSSCKLYYFGPGHTVNGTKAADGAFSNLGMSSLKQAVLQQHHVFSKASSQSAWLCQHHHIHSYGSADTLTEAWRLASLWETSSLQASLRKTYMRIVSQESKQLVSPLFTILMCLTLMFS